MPLRLPKKFSSSSVDITVTIKQAIFSDQSKSGNRKPVRAFQKRSRSYPRKTR